MDDQELSWDDDDDDERDEQRNLERLPRRWRIPIPV